MEWRSTSGLTNRSCICSRFRYGKFGNVSGRNFWISTHIFLPLHFWGDFLKRKLFSHALFFCLECYKEKSNQSKFFITMPQAKRINPNCIASHRKWQAIMNAIEIGIVILKLLLTIIFIFDKKKHSFWMKILDTDRENRS